MLLEAFKDNQLTGLSFVAFQRRGRYFTDITGSCASNPTLTRGALGPLMVYAPKLHTLLSGKRPYADVMEYLENEVASDEEF